MDKFDNAFNNAHEIEFDAFKFDEPDYEALIVTEESYLEHLRVQAAGLAYYGTLAKTAEREYTELERKYRNRYNEMYTECSDILAKIGKKNNVRDIEALVRCKYENELEQWENELSESKIRKDGISSYYDAWKAKGFALSSMTSLITAGLMNPKTAITESDIENMSNKKMNLKEAGSILANHRTKNNN
jgi:hypothetical protein